MKYIVLTVIDVLDNGNEHEREVPFIFPDALVHSEVAKAMTRMLRAEVPDGRKRQIAPVSAGFVSSMALGDRDAYHGKSETLGLASRNETDASLIMCYDYLHGVV